MKKFNDWKVYKNGDIIHTEMNYLISGDRLKENDWIEHMMYKGWVDLNDFIPAYFQALSYKNIESITIKLDLRKEYFPLIKIFELWT